MSRTVRVLALNVLLVVLAMSALRLAFYAVFRNPADAPDAAILLESLRVGFKFDLRLALLLNLPFALLAQLPVLDPFRRPRARRFWVGWYGVMGALLLIVYGVDFGHYGYLEARVDASVLRYLFDPRESFGVVWESYPLIPGLLAVFAAAGAYAFRLHRVFAGAAPSPAPGRLGVRVVAAVLLVGLYAFGIYGKLSYYPLRWSDAFFSTHSFASALSLNPVLYFAETFANRDLQYDTDAVKRHYATVADYLGVDDPDVESIDFTRPVGGERERRLNVVILLLESFAYYKTGVSGNPLDATPNFDAVARQGVLFHRFYTPHSGTARSVFASVVGLPDIDRARTSTRNPLIARQHSLLNAFEGWEKLYFLGGSASWGNIRALLSHNIEDLRIYEEGSYRSPRVDVWGISDLHLLEEAHRVLSQPRTGPFLAIVQTAGNHKPYTIPEDSAGFERSTRDEAEVQRFGFDTLAEFEAMRLIDHSLGHYFRLAREAGYFDDTLFVLYGDHGSPASPEHRPAADGKLALSRYHVPLVLYSPKHLPPRSVDEVASQLDVLPTLVGFAGGSGINSTLGRDLLDPAFADRRYALTVERLEKSPLVGLVSREFYFQSAADGSAHHLYRIESASPREDVSAEQPETVAEMRELALGLYESARYMRYHNAPEAVAAQRERGAPSVATAPLAAEH